MKNLLQAQAPVDRGQKSGFHTSAVLTAALIALIAAGGCTPSAAPPATGATANTGTLAPLAAAANEAPALPAASKPAHTPLQAPRRVAAAPRPATQQPAETAVLVEAAPAPKPVCGNCGKVEAATAVQVQGQGSGIGAIAGGVLGGVVGHQVGGGRGKDAMTILGALGGGLAGNEVEKRQRSSTVYDIRIRMADGSRRNFTQHQALAVGQHVRVEGEELMLDGSAVN